MQRRIILTTIVAALALLASSPASAQFTFGKYEGWKSAGGAPALKIRSDRWVGNDNGSQEVTRAVEVDAAGVPHLTLRMRQQGQTTDNVSFRYYANNNLGFTHPEKLTRVQAKFNIVRGKVGADCVANTSLVHQLDAARIFWVAFNDGSSTGPGDRTGDHQIDIRASRFGDTATPAGTFHVRADVCRCPNAGCDNSGPPFSCSGVSLADVQVGTPFTLRIIHDPAGASNAKLRASVVGEGAEQTFGYPSETPGNPAQNVGAQSFGMVQTSGFAANCTVASGGPYQIDALTHVFDIKTNPEAVIP